MEMLAWHVAHIKNDIHGLAGSGKTFSINKLLGRREKQKLSWEEFAKQADEHNTKLVVSKWQRH